MGFNSGFKGLMFGCDTLIANVLVWIPAMPTVVTGQRF